MRRRLKSLLLAAVLLVCLLPMMPGKADAYSLTTIPTGKYYIRNDANGQYLNVTNGGNWNGCNVDTWYFNGCSAQIWTITGNWLCYKVQPGCGSGRILNQWGNSIAPGHNVTLYDDVNDSTQRWVFQKQYGNRFIIRCVADANCVLDVDSNGNVYVNNYVEGRRSQWWYLTSAEVTIASGTYRIRPFIDDRYMQVSGSGDYNNCNVNLGTNGNINAAKWQITGSPTSYKVKPKNTASRVLNQWGDYVVSGHNVCLWDNTNDPTQRWTFEAVKYAYGNLTLYVIHCAGNPSCVLDIDSNGNVYVNTYGGQYDESQLWVLEAVN
ncbi:MAG: RICIN domain-containing protein [Paludibacteraceae bacterium]|nr:RICIN domain-containing protein [Paludibacteraceae bacterium]